MTAITHKRCCRCRETLPVSQFNVNKTRPAGTIAGYHGYCKPCQAEYRRQYRQQGRVATWPRHHCHVGRRIVPIGQNSHSAKLTNDLIKQIRYFLNHGETCARIARRFNVSRQCISSIKNGHYWTHIQ